MSSNGFVVVDMGCVPAGGGVSFLKRFDSRRFDTMDSANRFLMSLPRGVRRDAMVVPVVR